jgi:phosphatidylserine decarboxylase
MLRIGECWMILALSAAACAAAYIAWPPAGAVPAALFLFTLYFFRDPERNVPPGEGILVSPADGRILDVEDVVDGFVGGARRVSIFMSPFDVHVNRAPLSCTVKSVTHTPGTKVAAYLKGDLDARERNRVEAEGACKLAVEQYAGVVARRIVCYAKPGQSLKAGERFGMIKFGSRVDVVAPLNVKIKVVKGDRVAAGETIIGELTDG